ncbi:MAG: hypothetical protein V7629_08345 [Motiliproteus sp.]
MNQQQSEVSASLTAVGIITEVHGPVVVIRCDALPPLGRALQCNLSSDTCLLELHQHLDHHHARAITIALHDTAGLARGMPVYDRGTALQVPVSPVCLGRVLNVFGQPLDAGAPVKTDQYRPIHGSRSPLTSAVEANQMLESGIKVVDLLCPFVRGGKTGLFGGAGVGIAGVDTLGQLAGASATEETENILIQLTQTLSELEQRRGPFQLRVLFNHPDPNHTDSHTGNQISSQQLLPPFQQLSQTAPRGVQPLITMAPQKLLLGLGEHFLFANLKHILYLSLLAENQLRIVHLQGAIKKLEQRLLALQQRVNRMRQEAIVEEIELILINQSTLDSSLSTDK